MAEKIKTLEQPTEEVKERSAKDAQSASKTISVYEYLAEANIKEKNVADYAVVYLRKKVGFNGTKESYEKALNEFLTRKQ